MKYSVAIITRTVNRPLLLKRAIQSVLAQDYEDWVHVIVNDGGCLDEINHTIDPYRDDYAGRLQLVSNKISLGMEAASNVGIVACQSEYILIHDDDDSLEPEFISETVAYLENVLWNNIKGVATFVNKIEEKMVEGEVQPIESSLFRQLEPVIDINDLARANQIPNISFLYRRHVLDEIGMYDETLPVLGDWDFNLRFIAKYDIGIINKPLANYHQRPAIKQGDLSNTIYAQIDKHLFYATLVRNRFIRDPETQSIGLLMVKQAEVEYLKNVLRRLYSKRLFRPIIKLIKRLPGFNRKN